MTERTLRLFVSSPADVPDERRRIDLVVERLNTEFEGRARIETVRWETSYYSAHDTFQKQIPEAADCDVVVAIFRARLGTPLPASFPPLATGEPYPSGTAYEVLTAIEARKAGKGLPDIYVFRYPNAPTPGLDDPDYAETKAQWERLKGFFDTWFRNKSGEFTAAFQSYASTDDFAEKVEDCLRQWLARRGFVAQGPVWDRMLHGSPFPGLSAFEADRGAVFFGRELAIAQAIDRLRQAGTAGGNRLPFLLVIGASGSGKSSLLRAGLLPRLTLPGTIPDVDLWRTAIVTPGPDPFWSLSEVVFADAALGPELRDGMFRTPEILAKQLRGEVETAIAPLRDALDRAAARRQSEQNFDAPRPARLALVVDQAERLFVETDAKTAAAFADLLAALVRANLVCLILVLRSDAYARFQAIGAFLDLRRLGATFDLVPPNTAELEEIVRRPVVACHPPLAFEEKDGRSLSSLLVADAKGGDALPLLQMTLSRLYDAEAGRNDGLLCFADYRGMEAAVTETANAALDTLSAEARAELPALVGGLVGDVSTDPITGAAVPVVVALDRNDFEARKPARAALVEAFVAKRLLTAEGDGVSRRVRPVHEALLRTWPEAVRIVAENAALIRVRHTLKPMVDDWAAASAEAKAGNLAVSPALLAGAERLLERYRDDLSPETQAFITASIEADRRRRDAERNRQRRILGATGAGLVVALVLAALAGWQWQTAEAERREVETQRAVAQHSLDLATQTANGLVFDLAQKFRNVTGVPIAMIKDILDRARQLQEQLLKAGQTSPALRYSEAAALEETVATLLTLGDTKGALAAATQAREISLGLLKEQPGNAKWQRGLSIAYDKVGDVQVAQGYLPEALQSYRASLAIRERPTKSDPGNVRWQRGLSVSYDNIGDVQVAQDHLPDALQSYQASRAIIERLAKSDPGNAEWQQDLSVSYEKLGDVQVAQGHLSEALQSYQAFLTIMQRLAKSDPGNANGQRGLSIAYNKVGDVQVAQGHLPEALQSHRASLAIIERLAKSDRGNAEWQRDLGASYATVGNVLVAQGHLPEALQSYQATLAIVLRLAKSDPGNAGRRNDLLTSYAKLAATYDKMGDTAKERDALNAGRAVIAQLVAQHPDFAEWKNDLAWFDARIAALGK